jgi:hypothetical protein
MSPLSQRKKKTVGPQDPVTQSTVRAGAQSVGFAPTP